MSKEQINAAVLHGLGETPRCEPFAAPAGDDQTAVVTVAAAALKSADRWLAGGIRYASRSPTTFPVVAGTDGVGRLDDGTRVAFFAAPAPVRRDGGAHARASRPLARSPRWRRRRDRGGGAPTAAREAV